MADNRKPDEIAAELEITRQTGEQYLLATFGRIEGDSEAEIKARLALDNAAEAWRQIAAFHQRKLQDKTLTPSGRELASADFASKKLAKADAEIERASKAVADHAILLVDKLAKLLEPPASAGRAAIDTELRRHVAGLPADERIAFLETQADAATLQAVASAPAQLSGLNSQTHDRLKQRLFAAREPASSAMIERLAVAGGKLDKAKAELHRHSERLIDFRGAKQIAELAS